MKIILITILGVAAFMAAAIWLVFAMHEECQPQPAQNEMRNGCVYQKSGNNTIRTCG